MPALRCPYCGGEFEWTEQMGEGRVECPLCAKTMEVSRRTGVTTGPAEARASESTTWGTEGFASERRRAEYGGIKKGDVLGGFRVEEMVGAGAMAVVYRATQLSLDRPVALKILPTEFARRETFVRQFDSETELLASLNHPNIVNIIDRGREGDTYYFAMEYVEGTTLGELLAAGQMPEEFFLKAMEQCAEALSYAHSKGIVHRDIKPANIMLNDQGVVKIADFGVAGLLAEARAASDTKRRVMGTRGYMAPEQEVHVNRADERSDIFSLGAVMYRALTNAVPEQLPCLPPSQRSPEVDPGIDSLVLKCLEPNPQKRYQSAGELLDALRAYGRQVSRLREVCPRCKKENPVTQTTCLHCGADLAELFDACPECGASNRIDVEVCMGCGRNLSLIRQQQSITISKTEERARKLLARHRYDEAVAELGRISTVRGRVFQRARDRARRLAATYEQARAQYYESRVRQGRGLAGEGKLTESLEVLRSVPSQVAGRYGVSAFTRNVKSRMSLAKRRLDGIPAMLGEHRHAEAEKVVASVGRMWVDCPGLEEARRLVKASRETREMVDYEVAEVRRHLEQGETAEARKALEFALTTMPDNPAVKALQEEIDLREKAAMLKAALAEGKKAFEQENYRDAARYWTTACEVLPEGDPRRERLLASVQAAREKWLAHGVVRLEVSQVVSLREARRPLGGLLSARLLLPLLLAGAAIGAGVVFLVVARP
jgi:serine/threonine protein kinase/predicted metal-dependent hydrolase